MARRKSKTKGKLPKGPAPIDVETLNAAFESALTKYDTLDAWFEKSNVKQISNTLFDEMSEDVGVLSDEEPKAAAKVVELLAQQVAAGGEPIACDFSNGKVKSFRACSCEFCKAMLAKQVSVAPCCLWSHAAFDDEDTSLFAFQAHLRHFVMRNVGQAFGGWKARKAGAGGF